jgi:hypothetical protein
MSNYDEETTALIIEEYLANPCRETVDRIAIRIGKSTKSVIGKLSRERVYQRNSYTTKTGENPVTKLELIATLAVEANIPIEKLEGLEKAPKPVLKTLLEIIPNYEKSKKD